MEEKRELTSEELEKATGANRPRSKRFTEAMPLDDQSLDCVTGGRKRVYRRDEKEIFPVLGILFVFSVS